MAWPEANTPSPLLPYPAQFRVSTSQRSRGWTRVIIFRATIFVAANGTCDTLPARRTERAVVLKSENARRVCFHLNATDRSPACNASFFQN